MANRATYAGQMTRRLLRVFNDWSLRVGGTPVESKVAV